MHQWTIMWHGIPLTYARDSSLSIETSAAIYPCHVYYISDLSRCDKAWALTNQPEWWPDIITFCSPRSRGPVKMNNTNMRTVIQAFQNYCRGVGIITSAMLYFLAACLCIDYTTLCSDSSFCFQKIAQGCTLTGLDPGSKKEIIKAEGSEVATEEKAVPPKTPLRQKDALFPCKL